MPANYNGMENASRCGGACEGSRRNTRRELHAVKTLRRLRWHTTNETSALLLASPSVLQSRRRRAIQQGKIGAGRLRQVARRVLV